MKGGLSAYQNPGEFRAGDGRVVGERAVPPAPAEPGRRDFALGLLLNLDLPLSETMVEKQSLLLTRGKSLARTSISRRPGLGGLIGRCRLLDSKCFLKGLFHLSRSYVPISLIPFLVYNPSLLGLFWIQ